MDWYAGYGERHAADGSEGRLVTMYSFSESWTSWEMHPAGDEVVICTEGEITLIQESPDGTRTIALRAGEYAINPRGVWHTADVAGPATALFITAGLGTEHRPR
jgi:quercetin dioxygenase-like cupin family protein